MRPSPLRQGIALGALRRLGWQEEHVETAGERRARIDAGLEHHQRPPEDTTGDTTWRYWVIRGGRGSGKTAAASTYIDRCASAEPIRVGIIAPTLGDAVASCVEGAHGLQAVNPRIQLRSGARRLQCRWPNGSIATLFGALNAEDVERLRAGGNRHLDWGEEYSAWRQIKAATQQATLGLRLGAWPRTVITMTPKPRKEVRELLSRPLTVQALTADGRIPTIDDNPNLDPLVRAELLASFEGTRLGRQELRGELLEDVEGAQWTWETLEWTRHPAGQPIPDLRRIGVAIDPGLSARDSSDGTGIIVGGVTVDRHLYVLADRSVKATPKQWALAARAAFEDFDADEFIIETNLGGGDWCEDQLRLAYEPGERVPPVVRVRASRGQTKRLRAEPAAGMYEPDVDPTTGRPVGMGRVHHVGVFDALEEQQTTWTEEEGWSPSRLDALVWLVTHYLIGAGGPTPAHTSMATLRRLRQRGISR